MKAVPFTYEVYEDARLLFIRGEGVVTQSERLHAMVGWLENPAYARCTDVFCDFSMAQSTPTLADLQELIALFVKHHPAQGPRKLAVVASTATTFGVARVFDDLLKLEAVPLEVQVFFDRELAWAWLRPADAPLEGLT